MSLENFVDILAPLFGIRGGASGGRRPDFDDMPGLDDNLPDEESTEDEEQQTLQETRLVKPPTLKNKSWLKPCKASEARLTIVQITDVYTLENFASLRTMLQQIRLAQGSAPDNPSNRVISMLTGDFLSPYLLSSIDHGYGMMQALQGTPIDYLTFGVSVPREAVLSSKNKNVPISSLTR